MVKPRGKKQQHTVAIQARLPQSPSSTRNRLQRWPEISNKMGRLAMQELVSGHVFIINNFLTPQECHSLIRYAETNLGFPPVPAKVVPKRGEAFRNNSRISVSDPQYAEHMWSESGLGHLLKECGWATLDDRMPVGLNDNIRLYRYGPGQRFGRHYDDHAFDTKKRRTEYTLLIYLNNIGEDGPAIGGDGDASNSSQERPMTRAGAKSNGGETVFYLTNPKSQVSVTPMAGKALLHKHGSDCILHESMPVLKGYKYLFRSDVVFDKPA
ncbi:hypothetical protein EV182_003066 [Spiromyces aspiralis]|uniref:Uncharacterized protein n=1 Tax=Spiromyces aspiralis TaxID=68401 RepID=A0ACC1HGT4_9FUNG|nr:hypothetical protein EV182_003066 [Spiromyces aspiralis]